MQRLVESSPLELKIVDNRGTRVLPADRHSHRLRRRLALPLHHARLGGRAVRRRPARRCCSRLAEEHRFTHIEKLHEFDGVQAYSKAQGED